MITPSEIYNRYLTEISDIKDNLSTLRAAACGNVLEIGVRTGISTSALLCGVEEHGGHVYSVDLDDCGHLYAGHQQWTCIQADSMKDRERILRIVPKVFDLAFVDGDHSYDGCLSDLMNYGSRAKIVMAHDTECPNTWPGVRLAVDKYIEISHRPFKFLNEGYGLVIIE